MKYWNFRTPLSLIASLIWNIAEKYKIQLPKPHVIFGLMIQARSKKVLPLDKPVILQGRKEGKENER